MDAYTKIVFHRNIFIRSQDRVANAEANSSSFQVNFSAGIHPIINKDRFQQLVVKVLQVDVPLTWYSIETNANDEFILIEDVGGTNASPLTITMTEGNYSGAQLATELSTQLTAGSNVSGDDRTYNVAYNAQTNKLTYSYTGGNTGNAFIVASDTGNNQYLGLPVDGTLAISNGAATQSTNMINLARFPSAYIRSNIASLGRNLSGSTGHATDILCKFSPGEVPQYGIISFYPEDQYVRINDAQGINGLLTFELTDQLRNIIGLNGIEWSLMLELTIVEPTGITLFNNFQKQLFHTGVTLPKAVTEAYGFTEQYHHTPHNYSTLG